MYEITSHKLSVVNNRLMIAALDDAGDGSIHRYAVTGFDTSENPSAINRNGTRRKQTALSILFQNGPVDEVGVNGVTLEALFAIAIDQLEIQNAANPCSEFELALEHARESLKAIHDRTRDQIVGNIERKFNS